MTPDDQDGGYDVPAELVPFLLEHGHAIQIIIDATPTQPPEGREERWERLCRRWATKHQKGAEP